mgnify:CR=1 FL=1|tara:strand:+ start:454 stop:1353 length:900 start_codon:yes stop_codon:yes gene_type:complete
MIQTIHKSTGGTVRHVCSFGRPAAATFSWRLYKENGDLVDSANNVVGSMPDTTAHNSSSKRGDRIVRTVASLAGGWRNLMIQPQSLGTMESLRSFSMPFQVGTSNTDAVLFDPLPIDVASGDRIVVNEVQVAIGSATTSTLDAGVYLFEVIADDEAGDEHREVTRVAITSANLVQPANYASLTRRYPALLDQGRPEDPDFSVSLDTALTLVVESMERIGFGWYNLRSWDQLEASICARCAAQEFGAMGPDYADLAEEANEQANAYLRDTLDRFAWVDTDADDTPQGDTKSSLARVWVSR